MIVWSRGLELRLVIRVGDRSPGLVSKSGTQVGVQRLSSTAWLFGVGDWSWG